MELETQVSFIKVEKAHKEGQVKLLLACRDWEMRSVVREALMAVADLKKRMEYVQYDETARLTYVNATRQRLGFVPLLSLPFILRSLFPS